MLVRTAWMNRKRTVRLLDVTALLVLVIIAGSTAAVVIDPPEEEPATEFFILSDNGSGEPVAGGYSEQLRTTDGSIHLGIEHGLEETRRYTLVVQLQRINVAENSTEVVERTNIETIPIRVDPGARALHQVDLNRASDQQYSRIAFLLYLDSAPSDPSIENAHRSTYVWVDPQTEADQ